jgi:4-hydroxy 2-oxovalerate aldolase
MKVGLCDSSLRDGMHTVSHQFSCEQVSALAAGLDRAGVDRIEVGHGDGLGGSSIQYGYSAATDDELLEAAASAIEHSTLMVLVVPGIGTVRDLQRARDRGAGAVRVATHCTEADIAQQHIEWARAHDMRAMAFLMMAHMLEPEGLAEQAKLMESYGAEVVYITDSAGALVPRSARERVAALREALDCEVGFHAHNNLGCAVGNALAAVEAGATWLDGSLRGLGAGAGNAQLEVLVAALERSGHTTAADLFALVDLAEEVAAPMMPRAQVIDRGSLLIGYAGVYSSFLLHTERAAQKYGVDSKDVLLELGRRRTVGGQEDMIIDVAAQLAERRSDAGALR